MKTFENNELSSIENYIVLDIETTGLSPIGNDIIEIAAIKVKNNNIVNEFETLINPGCSIPSSITNLTGISDEMVYSAPYIKDILLDFIDFVEDLPIVAHNASFDMKFINYNIDLFGYSLCNEVIDTLQISRQLYPHFENHKLNNIANELDVNVENAHRAMSDVIVLNDIFKIMLNSIKCNTEENISNIADMNKEACI